MTVSVYTDMSEDACDARRYRALFKITNFCRDPLWPVADWMRDSREVLKAEVDAALDAAGVQRTPAAESPSKDRITAMVDAATVEMSNIHPPLRRSECERLIRAAYGVGDIPPNPCKLTECRGKPRCAKCVKAGLNDPLDLPNGAKR